jgi:carboxymethylenebutenolidase
MSGGLVISAARAYPNRVAAVASIHGAWLVRDTEDSPHLNLDRVNAEIYLGWCDNDATAPLEDKATWEAAAKAAGVDYTLDFFTDAEHGYAPPYGRHYNREASELHWERVHSLFRRHLR